MREKCRLDRNRMGLYSQKSRWVNIAGHILEGIGHESSRGVPQCQFSRLFRIVRLHPECCAHGVAFGNIIASTLSECSIDPARLH